MVRLSNAQKLSGRNRLATGKAVAGLLLSLLCAGCVGVTPLPKRTRTAQGQVKNVDPSFIRVGHTSRAEVLEKLKPFDTGFQSNRFFLGRSSTSKWGAWIIVAGELQAAGAAGRLWHISNLLVEFDDKGVVKNFEVFPDKFLVPKLGPVAADEKALDGSQRKELSVRLAPAVVASRRGWEVPAKIILYNGSLEFVKPGAVNGKPIDFTIDRAKIKSIRPDIPTAAIRRGTYFPSDVAYTTLAIRFTEKPKSAGGLRGKGITVGMTLPDLVVLINFMTPRENAPT